MNISEAKEIQLLKAVEHLGGRYSHTDRQGNIWCFSPFRPEEKTASFKINTKLNNWYDFGHSGIIKMAGKTMQGSGGDILDLFNDYFGRDRKTGIPQTLKEVEQLNHSVMPVKHITPREKEVIKEEPRYKILKIADGITFIGLKEELQKRKISYELANLYLKQGYILDTVTDKKYNAFLFENGSNGYEVSIPNPKNKNCFKTSIGGKGSTYFAPSKESKSAEVFEGFWDWLSWLEIKKIKYPIHHSFILNSTSFANEVVQKIHSQQELNYVFLFLDNDNAGFQTTHSMALEFEEMNLKIASMDGFYKDYKDVSEYLQKAKFRY